MYFLIDYENVNYAGLEGTEYLEKGDTVIFFYSDCCKKIKNYRMKDIKNSGASFEICKLRTVKKNALDFYIATKIGEIFGKDRSEKIAIISADKDHVAVMDYWHMRIDRQGQMVEAKTIAHAIQMATGEWHRKQLIMDDMKLVEIEDEYIRYEERNKLFNMLDTVFGNTEYETLIPDIRNIMLSTNEPKKLYLNSLKTFGKKTGTEVYRQIRDNAVSGVN